MFKVGLTRHSIGRRQIGQIRRWWVHTTPDELYDIPWLHIKYGIVRTERDNPFFGSTPYDRLHCCNGRRHRRGFHQMFGTHICGLVWIERQRITRQGFESNRKFIGAKRELLSIRELGAAAVRRNADGSKGKRHPLDTVKDDSKVNLFYSIVNVLIAFFFARIDWANESMTNRRFTIGRPKIKFLYLVRPWPMAVSAICCTFIRTVILVSSLT